MEVKDVGKLSSIVLGSACGHQLDVDLQSAPAILRRHFMSTVLSERSKIRSVSSFNEAIEVTDYNCQKIPGASGKLGNCFVRVVDLPVILDQFMDVNPRVPKRTQKGVLSGPVIKGILSTLFENPKSMALKNQGIFLTTRSADYATLKGGIGQLKISMTDKSKHGIVNGGHTWAAIRQAIETCTDEEYKNVSKAYVRLHIFQGIDPDSVIEMAEGLNRSKQVDDPSLQNLRGMFSDIKKAMKGKMGADAISYFQGDEGEYYITEILQYIELFNCDRFSNSTHPNGLYRQQTKTVRMFETDYENDSSPIKLIVPILSDILILSDKIRKNIKISAAKVGFQFGRMKSDNGKRTGSCKYRNTKLSFIGESVDYRVPNSWIMPMLAAFRANAKWDSENKQFGWLMPLEELFELVIDDLTSVCVSEYKDLTTNDIGRKISTYRQCYQQVQLQLAIAGLLTK